MSHISSSIGERFENFLNGFDDLEFTGHDECVPDFYSPHYGFWLEAKAGNIAWGSQIKNYQITEFKKLEEPVIYALGFHNFDDAYKRLTHKTKTQRRKYLERHLDFLRVNFITNSLMELLYSREHRLNAKGTIDYCVIKDRTLNNIFTNRLFKRNNIWVNTESYYHFSYSNYQLFKGAEGEEIPWYQAVIKKKGDENFHRFLQDYHQILWICTTP